MGRLDGQATNPSLYQILNVYCRHIYKFHHGCDFRWQSKSSSNSSTRAPNRCSSTKMIESLLAERSFIVEVTLVDARGSGDDLVDLASLHL